jgi:hypothetical protein
MTRGIESEAEVTTLSKSPLWEQPGRRQKEFIQNFYYGDGIGGVELFWAHRNTNYWRHH